MWSNWLLLRLWDASGILRFCPGVWTHSGGCLRCHPSLDLFCRLGGQADKLYAYAAFRFIAPRNAPTRLDPVLRIRQSEAKHWEKIRLEWRRSPNSYTALSNIQNQSAIRFGQLDVRQFLHGSSGTEALTCGGGTRSLCHFPIFDGRTVSDPRAGKRSGSDYIHAFHLRSSRPQDSFSRWRC